MSVQNALITSHQYHGLNLGLLKARHRTAGVNKTLAFAAYEEKTICSISGKGYIDTLWFGMSVNNTFLKNARLKVFVDGESTPSLNFDLGSLGLHFSSGYTNGWTEHVFTETNSSYPAEVVCFRFPIPYSTGIVIQIKSNVAQTSSISTYAYYVPDADIPLRLKSVNVPYDGKITILGSENTVYEFFNLSGEGWIVWHSMAMEPVTDNSHLQSKLSINLNGEGTPSIDSVNLLNWFMDSNDFNEWPMSTSWKMLSICPNGLFYPKKFNVGVDLLELFGGIRFDSGARAVLDTTPAAMATDFSFGHTWLYYQPT
ncbi:MAG: hypothetical protein AB1847_17535 [bacterium]